MMWIAQLTDGKQVAGTTGDDWRNLKAENPQITGLGFAASFQDNDYIVPMPSHQDGYFFGFGMVAAFGGESRDTVLLGFLKEDKLYISKIILPECIVYDKEVRNNLNDPRLIKNPLPNS